MALDTHFFHDTIKLYTGVFGTVFNDLKIKRDSKLIKVPIAYSLKQKYDARNTENPDPNFLRKKTTLPRMGYRLTQIARDTTRMTNKMFKLVDGTVDRATTNSIKMQYNRVPYVFNYELNIKTKNLEDMNQILEQILPFFNPALNVLVDDNKDIKEDTSINIKLLDAGLDNMFEGSFEDEQIVESVLQFSLEGYLYMPTQEAKIIKAININYRQLGLQQTDPNSILETDRVVP